MMKDFLGVELEVGDNIVACASHGRNSGATLVRGKIVGFTNEFVKVHAPYYNTSNSYEYKISPKKVIKI